MKNLFFALAIMLFVYSAFTQKTDSILQNYISVKEALVHGDSKAASEAIRSLFKSLNNEENFAQND